MSPSLIANSHGLFLASETGISDLNSKNSRASKTEDASSYATSTQNNKQQQNNEYKLQIVWRNVLIFVLLHAICVYGFALVFTGFYNWKTLLFTYIYTVFGGFGITAGAHRLWAHRTYKANLPLRIFLMFAQCAALQNDIHEWVRDHRVHHKFTDTNADPHNASRGFFFSHVGWLLCKKHKDVMVKGKTVDMSDVLADPVVRFQMRHYIPLVIVWNILIPTWIPWYFFGEEFMYSFVICMARYTLSLNGTWLVNSAAHIWGMKPYDSTIKPTESLSVSIIAFGEGWHNYHHIFPWDYKAAELGNYRVNFTTAFLDLMARIGWATELKTASEDMIKKRVLRTGDGTWYGLSQLKNNADDKGHHHHDHGDMLWGWGDTDMGQNDVKEILKFNRIKG
ncbi:acyl-CoA Delta-9 desaturase-like isoform X2 [Rhynchophorus ferrugineus]|uniref:acyl-CoA Delta-9 desaturase-like isoform X2 n=1 Tax=Rhynchophorus ferrugineus TaxID=354439 RepID=UPI003FCC97BC